MYNITRWITSGVGGASGMLPSGTTPIRAVGSADVIKMLGPGVAGLPGVEAGATGGKGMSSGAIWL